MSIISDSKNVQLNNNSDSSYARWRNAVYECLVDAGMEKDASRWLDCETYHRSVWDGETPPVELPKSVQYVMACSESPQKHPLIVQKHTCGLRYCPTCAEQHSARFLRRYVPVATKLAKNGKRYRLRHIVLTTPYGLEDDDIKERYKQHQKNVRDLMYGLLGQGDWRKRQGFIACDEFGEKGNKLHTHIVHFGKFIPKENITWGWKQITGGECEVNWIEAIRSDQKSIETAISEVLKYCTKFWREDDDGNRKMIKPELMPKLAEVLKGQRRVRTYGVFYNIPEEKHDKECKCSICGAEMKKVWRSDWQAFVESGFTWQEIDILIDEDALESKTANKSLLKEAHIGDKPPLKQQILPNFRLNQYQLAET